MSPALLISFHSDLKAEPCPRCPLGEAPPPSLPLKQRGAEIAGADADDALGCGLNPTACVTRCCGAVHPWEGQARASSPPVSAQFLLLVRLPSCSFLSPHPDLTEPPSIAQQEARRLGALQIPILFVSRDFQPWEPLAKSWFPLCPPPPPPGGGLSPQGPHLSGQCDGAQRADRNR